MILMLVSMVAIAALALVSFELSHAQTEGENVGFMESSRHHMYQDDWTDYDGNLAHMNETQHIQGNMYNKCEDMHESANMTRHMENMH